ncbi:MAG: TIGR01458 family HAD-type hydrolase [Actinobacteria bacterium]|nr:TIGR01458 family HAD-type hydrolase [Actinomycetota bacterium]
MTPPAFAPRAVLLDVDGVLVTAWRAIPGAPAAVRTLRGAGVGFRLVTNTTERSRASIARLLGAAGIEVEEEEIVTANVATREHLRAHHPGARCFLLASGEAREDLEGVDWVEEDAEVVVVGGPGPEFTYDRVNRAFRMVMDGARLVAMHRNRYWMTDEGLRLDAGAYVLGLEHAAGVEAVTVGKPAPAMFEGALRTLGAAPAGAAMVGDDLENDVLAAQALGLTGVLVRTGKFREEDLAAAAGRPDLVIGSVAELPALLGLA